MKFMLITNHPKIAKYAETSGVERIFVDMEKLGKDQRQGHLDTHKAAHSLADIRGIRSVLTSAELMVRINPLNLNTQVEVDSVIAAGADRIMLPMFCDTEDVRFFKGIIGGRVPITYLAETPKALVTLPEWMEELRQGDQVHFGLNDLSLAMDLDFLFEILAARMLDFQSSELRRHRIDFGIGGIGRAGEGMLSAFRILGEHVRLGSNWVILSRSFHGGAQSMKDLMKTFDLATEIGSLLEIEADWRRGNEKQLETNHSLLASRVFEIAKDLKARKVTKGR